MKVEGITKSQVKWEALLENRQHKYKCKKCDYKHISLRQVLRHKCSKYQKA